MLCFTRGHGPLTDPGGAMGETWILPALAPFPTYEKKKDLKKLKRFYQLDQTESIK